MYKSYSTVSIERVSIYLCHRFSRLREAAPEISGLKKPLAQPLHGENSRNTVTSASTGSTVDNLNDAGSAGGIHVEDASAWRLARPTLTTT